MTRPIGGITPILDEKVMRELGFTDHRPGHWYFCKRVGNMVTLNVTIDKTTGEWSEDVLDEYCLQPEYYGKMKEPYRSDIRANVDLLVSSLRSHGLNVQVDHSEYGWVD